MAHVTKREEKNSHAVGAGKGNTKLFLVTGGRDDKGLEAWHYVRVPSLRQASFNRAVMTGQVNFTEFGEVVLSGYGATPPEDVKKRMEADEK